MGIVYTFLDNVLLIVKRNDKTSSAFFKTLEVLMVQMAGVEPARGLTLAGF